MIGQKFNFDEVFFRDLTVCVLDTLEGRLNWINRFSSGNIPVSVPIYYSMTGDDRFLLDSFQDDIVSENRYVELNTDQIPRGHLTLTNFNIRSDEFRNPNVWLRTVIEDDVEVKKLLKKVRAIPITVTYDLTIILKNEIDIFKCAQEIMNTLWLYRFMYFEHNYMHIDAVMLMPDSETIQIQREKNLKSDDSVRLTATIEVQTYYPAFVDSNQEKIKKIVTSVESTKAIKLNSVSQIYIGQVLYGSGTPYNVKVVSIFSECNIVILSTEEVDLEIGQVVTFGENNQNFDFSNSGGQNYEVIDIYGNPIRLNTTNGIVVGATVSETNSDYPVPTNINVVCINQSSNSIIVNNNFNYIYQQPLSISNSTYTTLNGLNVINLSSLEGIQIGQLVSGDNIPNVVRVIDIDEENNFVVVSRPVNLQPGQNLFFAFDNNFNESVAPYRTRWFNNLYSKESRAGKSSNVYSSLNYNERRYKSGNS